MIDKNNDNPDPECIIPAKYLKTIVNFLNNEKYSIISLVIQKGKIVGCDILEKKRDFS